MMAASSGTDCNQTPNSMYVNLAVSLWEISSMDKRETAQIVN